MRQVPIYLIIGNGRIARHFQHYFTLLHIPFLHWHRQMSQSKLEMALPQATHILLLISDDAIDTFISQQLANTHAMLIHFSGSLVSAKAYGAHPLMSFNQDVYTLEQYQTIPFVIDHDAPEFTQLLPGLPNHHERLDKSQKEKYHALCVSSGNFSCLLWQKFFTSLEHEFKLPRSIAYAYLERQMQNLMRDAESALTGPLVRGDKATIEKNIAALQGDAFQSIYQSFVEYYNREHS